MKQITIDICQACNIEELVDVLTSYNAKCQKEKDYSLCKAIYFEDIQDLNDWMKQVDLGLAIGTHSLIMQGKENTLGRMKQNIQYAIEYLKNPPLINNRKPIVWDEMPDLLSDEDLSQYFGWAISTIQSKRSRGELPKLNSLSFTSKNQLREFLDATSDSKKTDKEEEIRKKLNSFKRP